MLGDDYGGCQILYYLYLKMIGLVVCYVMVVKVDYGWYMVFEVGYCLFFFVQGCIDVFGEQNLVDWIEEIEIVY